MEKIASKALGPAAHADPAPDAPLPDEYWEAHLSDLRAAGRPGLPIQPRRLSEIPREVLCVECARCSRCVEIQRLDAIRLFGPHAVLDHGCQVRTGRHEEDGCWPDFSY
jgi:ferredoxin